MGSAQQGCTQRPCLYSGEDALSLSLHSSHCGSFPALSQSSHPTATTLHVKSFPQYIHCNPSFNHASYMSSRAKATPPLPEMSYMGRQRGLWPLQQSPGHPLYHTPWKQQGRLFSQSLHHTRSWSASQWGVHMVHLPMPCTLPAPLPQGHQASLFCNPLSPGKDPLSQTAFVPILSYLWSVRLGRYHPIMSKRACSQTSQKLLSVFPYWRIQLLKMLQHIHPLNTLTQLGNAAISHMGPSDTACAGSHALKLISIHPT